ncbi:MAG: sodium:solute symporter family protein [Bryobacterales bacterium]|nr:sodium:solute symporter family protein [Bryobacterales bacterium]
MDWMLVPAAILAFLLVTLYLGLRAAKGRQRSVSEHVVAGRGMPLLLVFFIAVGEIYSSLSFLGQPGWAYAYGVPILYATMNGTMVSMVSYWLGPHIWRLGKSGNYFTQAHFLGETYQSPLLRQVASVVALVALIPYISVQIMGAGYVFKVTTEGRIPYWLGSLIAFAVVAIYVSKGGLRSISWVAVFKGIFMLTVGGTAVILVIGKHYGSLTELFRQVAAESPQHLTLPGNQEFMTHTFWMSSILIGMFGFYMWPHLFQNFFGARDEKTIKVQAAMIPVYNVIGWMFIMVGFAGILKVSNVETDAVMIEMVMRTVPQWLVAFFCAGALSASMVTASAATLVSAATLANDLCQPRLNLTDEQLRKLIQWLVIVVMTAAYLFAILQSSTIAFVMLMAYGFVSQFFPLVIAAIYWPGRLSGRTAVTGLAIGAAVAAFFTVGPIQRPGGFHPGLIGLAANVVTLFVLARFQPKR